MFFVLLFLLLYSLSSFVHLPLSLPFFFFLILLSILWEWWQCWNGFPIMFMINSASVTFLHDGTIFFIIIYGRWCLILRIIFFNSVLQQGNNEHRNSCDFVSDSFHSGEQSLFAHCFKRHYWVPNRDASLPKWELNFTVLGGNYSSFISSAKFLLTLLVQATRQPAKI